MIELTETARWPIPSPRGLVREAGAAYALSGGGELFDGERLHPLEPDLAALAVVSGGVLAIPATDAQPVGMLWSPGAARRVHFEMLYAFLQSQAPDFRVRAAASSGEVLRLLAENALVELHLPTLLSDPGEARLTAVREIVPVTWDVPPFDATALPSGELLACSGREILTLDARGRTRKRESTNAPADLVGIDASRGLWLLDADGRLSNR